MDPLTLLGLGSAAYNYFNKPNFMKNPTGMGIAALEEFGGFAPYAVNPTLGGINALLELADQFTTTNIPNFKGNILNPTVANLYKKQYDNLFKNMKRLPTPQPQPTFDPGPPDRQTRSGGNPFSQPAPQKTFINAPAFKGMGYTRGR